MKKKIALLSMATASLLLLTACGTSQITSNDSGIWEKIVYIFAQFIKFLSFGGSIGIGIILFTIVIRTILLPLMSIQMKSSQRMQEVQPEVKKIQEKYPGKDTESRRLMNEEIQELYAKHKVNPYTGCLPLLVQMPVLFALYQAMSRTDILSGNFLWFNVEATGNIILLLIAAALTFLSSYLNMKSAPEKNGMMTAMTYLMPILIFVMGLTVQAGLALYWVISNAYQVFQTLLLANPWKIIAARESKVKAVKDKEKARERALKKAKRK